MSKSEKSDCSDYRDSAEKSRSSPEKQLTLPGFTRGLAVRYAFDGLSKICPTSAMDGVPIATRRDALKCGVAAVDLTRGQLVGPLEFQTAVEEIFDVQVLPGIRFPELVGLQKESLLHTFIPPEVIRTSPNKLG